VGEYRADDGVGLDGHHHDVFALRDRGVAVAGAGLRDPRRLDDHLDVGPTAVQTVGQDRPVAGLDGLVRALGVVDDADLGAGNAGGPERVHRLVRLDVRDDGGPQSVDPLHLVDEVRPEQARADDADPDRLRTGSQL